MASKDNCSVCGKVVGRSPSSRSVITCRDCRRARRELGMSPPPQKAGSGRPKRIGPTPKRVHRPSPNNSNCTQCVDCGKWCWRSTHRKGIDHVCRECQKSQAKNPKTPPVHQCLACGDSFNRYGGTYCTIQCANRHKAKQAKDERAAARGRRRKARMKAAFVEKVDRLVVFERDNWTCHICHESVLREPPTKRHPMMASLDHVIPIAKGGKHSYANTACSHLLCNAKKSDLIAA